MRRFALLLILNVFLMLDASTSRAQEITQFLASDGVAEDTFGRAVAVSGAVALVGARNHTPVDIQTGAAYVYRYDGTDWVEEQKLVPGDGSAGDQFGFAVALEGNVAVVGANMGEAVYVFRFDGSNWNQEAKLTAWDGVPGQFGWSVGFSGLNPASQGTVSTIAVGSPWAGASNQGAIYVFEHNGSTWAQLQKLVPVDIQPSDHFGSPVDVGDNWIIGRANSDDACGGTPGCDSGAVYVYYRSSHDPTLWEFHTKLIASDTYPGHGFGSALSINVNTAVIGAPSDDEAATNAGAAYVFNFTNFSWSEEKKLIAADATSGDRFGADVANVSGDADNVEGVIIVGAGSDLGDRGSAYEFQGSGASWDQIQKITASDGSPGDRFGNSVATTHNLALVGAPFHDGSGNDAGTAYMYAVGTANIRFNPITNALPALTQSSAAWGDYDGDGDLDLALAGHQNGTGSLSRIFRNDAGIFSAQPGAVPFVESGSLAWGDYNGDEYLDLLVTGYRSQTGTRVSAIIRYTPGQGFVDVGTPFVGLSQSSGNWGDYDNDGDLDILLTGTDGTNPRTIIYRNDDGVFVDSGIAILGVQSGSAVFGDYDNDGDLDIVLAGTSSTGPISRRYRNDGGSFSVDASLLPDVSISDLAWGDHDMDGLSDLVVIGSSATSTAITRLFPDGAGGGELATSLSNVMDGAIAWGDADGDGDFDLFIAGKESPSPAYAISRMYETAGRGSFYNIPNPIPNMFSGDVAWGDIDNDSDLDFVIVGNSWNEGTTSEDPIVATSMNTRASFNLPPSAPSGLSTSVTDNSVTFSWNSASDAATATPGLTYNLRVGTVAGDQDVMSSLSSVSNGYRRVPQVGNVGHRTSWTLTLEPGVYVWSVQSVDQAFAGSPFAPERTFWVQECEVPPPTVAPTTWNMTLLGSWIPPLCGELGPVAAQSNMLAVYADLGPGSILQPVWLVDTSVPSNPVTVGVHWTDIFQYGPVNGLALDGARMYVSQTSQFSVVDVADPRNPSQIGLFTDIYDRSTYQVIVREPGMSVALGWGHVSEEDGSGEVGYMTLDVTDPAWILETGGAAVSQIMFPWPNSVAIDLGQIPERYGFVWVGDGTGGPRLSILGGPSSCELAHMFGSWIPGEIDVGDNHAFLVTGDFHVLDYADIPASCVGIPTPELAPAVTLPLLGSGASVVALGDYAHVGLSGSPGTTAIVDILDPLDPREIAGFDAGSGCTALDANGITSYVAVDEILYIVQLNLEQADTQTGQPVYVSLGDDVDVTFQTVNGAGVTRMFYGEEGPWLPGGFKLGTDPPAHYDIVTSAETEGTIEVCIQYDDADLTGPEGDLRLMHYDEILGEYVDVTTFHHQGLNIICGEVSSLSPFTLAIYDGVTGTDPVPSTPLAYRLHPPVPNPFNPRTTIRFDLPRPDTVELRIYSVSGRLVRVLKEKGLMPAGSHSLVWDASDDSGNRVASGVYMIRLTTDHETRTRRAVLLK